MNGKKTNLRRNDFLTFADAAGIPRKASVAMITKTLAFVPLWQKMCGESLLPPDLKQVLCELILSRAARIA